MRTSLVSYAVISDLAEAANLKQNTKQQNIKKKTEKQKNLH